MYFPHVSLLVHSCLAHFPPADTYGSSGNVHDVSELAYPSFPILLLPPFPSPPLPPTPPPSLLPPPYAFFLVIFQVVKTVRQFREKGRSRCSVLLYGHGDGGGGPT